MSIIKDAKFKADLIAELLTNGEDHPDAPEVRIGQWVETFITSGISQEEYELIREDLRGRGWHLPEKPSHQFRDVNVQETLIEETAEALDHVLEAVEQDGFINFRNGLIGGTILGAVGGILHRGVNVATLASGTGAVIGSYFLGDHLNGRANELTNNHYSRLGGGILIGAVLGAGVVYGADLASDFVQSKLHTEDSVTVISNEEAI